MGFPEALTAGCTEEQQSGYASSQTGTQMALMRWHIAAGAKTEPGQTRAVKHL